MLIYLCFVDWNHEKALRPKQHALDDTLDVIDDDVFDVQASDEEKLQQAFENPELLNRQRSLYLQTHQDTSAARSSSSVRKP